ncbi:MAG: sugar phosphate isomerase/epimerase [Chloroflexi bacterium]|nr:sugar phosphate isomerase/epimerase [Chloroflexota bacterium]MCI0578840.1 sugar phosphate isomerase/epimerase [Chloroflexota bacterium]MCI0648417.1 sugar phosphate isomerase/epimerase [Chloroflexota bacterium]MCI0727653.1 sugar phosphate isomerase/epimerase [Chloroflexota bacterium]
MNFLFSTGSLWSYSVERCFALAAAAGFDGLELMVDQRWETRQAEVVRRLIDQHSLPVGAVHSPFSAYVPGWPQDQPGRIRESVSLAEAVGAAVVVHHLPARFSLLWVQAPGRFFPVPLPLSLERDYQRWLEREYAAFQAGIDVKLCIENMPAYRRFGRRWNYCRWNTPAEIVRFPHLTMDTTHLGTWGLEPVEVYPRLDSRVAHVHLSNYDGREHRRPECGDLQLDQLLACLATDNYQGAVTLELHPDALDAGRPDEQIIALLAASLAHCRRWAYAQ